MRKIIKPFICTFFMLMILISTSIVVSAKDQRVFDDAGLLKDNEINELEDKISDLRDKYKDYDFVILTTNEYISGDPVDYAEKFYFDQGHSFKDKGFMLLINMKSRIVTISAMGDAQKVMNADDNQAARNNITSNLTSKYYYDACDTFLSDMGNVIDSHKKKLTPIELCVVIVIPALVFVIFVAAVKSKYGKEGESQPYPFKERGKVQLTHKDDVFVREYTTHVKIQSSSGGGGGGSYHSSSSGRSSGGSSSF